MRISRAWLAPLFLALCGAAEAGTILDQSNLSTGDVGFNDDIEVQQQVTDGIGGVLAGIELFTLSGADNVVVSVGLGSTFFSGSFAFSTAATLAQAGTFIDTSAADISLRPGEKFVIDVSGGPGCCNLAGATTAYAGGDVFFDSGPTIEDLTDIFPASTMAFETFMENSSSAPEPGTLVLFGCGIIFGFTWVRRERGAKGNGLRQPRCTRDRRDREA